MERVTEAGGVFETDHRGCSTMRQHLHASSFATIVLSGAYVEVRDAVPEVCHGGRIVVHGPCEEHADRFASDTRCLNVELSCRSELRGGSIAVDAMLDSAVRSVVRAFYDRPQELPEAVEGFQLALARRSLPPESAPPYWLQRALAEFSWEEPIPLRVAASGAGVHETHFSRMFRRHVGMTANAYRMRARVQVASRLLLTTASSIAHVAVSAGFSDQSHLTRAFTQTLGLSPAHYRRTFAR